MELNKLRDELAKEFSGIDKCTGIDLVIATAIHSACEQTFDRLLSALTDASGEWGAKAAHKAAPDNCDMHAGSDFENGARWQWESDRARIGLAEMRLREGKLFSDADNKRIHELEAQVRELEEIIAAIKDGEGY